MSHTSEISAVAIVDIQALELTIAELNKAGVRCSLHKNVKPRAYYPNQPGMGVAPYMVKLDDSRYDIGLYENGKGGYVARTDLFGVDIAKLLGAKPTGKETPEQAALGKFYQGYAVNAAVRQAAKQGYRVTRNTQADGTVQLVMTGM